MRLSISPETGDELPEAKRVAKWRLQLLPVDKKKGRPRIVRADDGEVLELPPEATEEDCAEFGVAGYTLQAVGYEDGEHNPRRVVTRMVELDTDESGETAPTDGPVGDGARLVLEGAAMALQSSAALITELGATVRELAKINAEANAAPENNDRISQILETIQSFAAAKKASDEAKATPKVVNATVEPTPAATEPKK